MLRGNCSRIINFSLKALSHLIRRVAAWYGTVRNAVRRRAIWCESGDAWRRNEPCGIRCESTSKLCDPIWYRARVPVAVRHVANCYTRLLYLLYNVQDRDGDTRANNDDRHTAGCRFGSTDTRANTDGRHDVPSYACRPTDASTAQTQLVRLVADLSYNNLYTTDPQRIRPVEFEPNYPTDIALIVFHSKDVVANGNYTK